MDIDNVKLPWEEILESYIKHNEKVRPDLDVRSQMAPIIESLNSNNIRSRTIVNAGKAVCYAFYLSPESMSDRYYGMIGFVSKEDYTEGRLQNILSWLISESSQAGKMLMFNEIFNASDYDSVLEGLGIKRLDRVKMVLENLDDLKLKNDSDFSGLSTVPVLVTDVPEIVRMHELSFHRSQDKILESQIDSERNKFWVNLFEGRAFGRIIKNCTLWLNEMDQRVGAAITTLSVDEPLLVDIFVIPEKQKHGFASFLISRLVQNLKELGYAKLGLWVSKSNPALKTYHDLGFVEVPEKMEIIYFRNK